MGQRRGGLSHPCSETPCVLPAALLPRHAGSQTCGSRSAHPDPQPGTAAPPPPLTYSSRPAPTSAVTGESQRLGHLEALHSRTSQTPFAAELPQRAPDGTEEKGEPCRSRLGGEAESHGRPRCCQGNLGLPDTGAASLLSLAGGEPQWRRLLVCGRSVLPLWPLEPRGWASGEGAAVCPICPGSGYVRAGRVCRSLTRREQGAGRLPEQGHRRRGHEGWVGSRSAGHLLPLLGAGAERGTQRGGCAPVRSRVVAGS